MCQSVGRLDVSVSPKRIWNRRQFNYLLVLIANSAWPEWALEVSGRISARSSAKDAVQASVVDESNWLTKAPKGVVSLGRTSDISGDLYTIPPGPLFVIIDLAARPQP